ncbi:hypothetical protein [Mycobacterium shigaense]|uniref:Uncharacterized protein n=1 Tax=Mycobacterium shigaense TaxID=722731 RepID=A0A1Z4EJQ7_9MYCO|nr:hypothetical protein [Mycobacterium shigaense]PRI15533.1 hypothetical protein B2J96_09040 [Mycobacterium shigaense]BAX93197.1 hypothetical protein MSG_03057 [Mycobacterium shigaense]
MKTNRETPKRTRGSARRRGRDGAARTSKRASAESASRRSRPGKVSMPSREARAHNSGPQTSPHARPVERSSRPKSARQAKARAKARKAKAPKVIRPRLTERLAMRLASMDLRPRTLLSKVPFVVLIIGALGLGLGLTLWLSTDSAERSYRLSHAREKNRMLQQQAESLEREVREAEAAPALAEAARKQGMIPTRDTAHLVQDPSGSWVVVGTPKPADGVPPPPLNAKLPDAAPPGPPKPPALPAEVPVRIEPSPGLSPAPARSGPEALLRAPDGSTTVGGQHIPQTAPLPGMPGGPATGQPPVAMPLPGLPAPAAPEAPGVPNQVPMPIGGMPIPVPGQLPAPMPAEVPVPLPRGIAPVAPRVGGPLIPGASVLPPAAPVAPVPNSGQQIVPPAALPGAPR